MALRWYVVHTYSGYENKVKAALEEKVRGTGTWRTGLPMF